MLVRIAKRLETSVSELVGEACGARADDEMFARLAVPGAVELIAAYCRLPTAALRESVLRMARDLAEPASTEGAARRLS